MGMTREILERRRRHLGASETAVVLGYGAYAGQTPDSVYWKKVGPPVETETDATALGNDLEPALVHWAEKQLGVTFDTDPAHCFQVMIDGLGKGILSATPDGIHLDDHALGKRWGLEAKAVMYGNPGIDQWGDEGTDKVPDNVIIQAQQQAAVWNLDIVWVPVFWCVGLRPELRMYHVKRDPEFWGMCIEPPAVQWWHEHIVTQIPPGDEPPPMEVIKAMQRKQGPYVPADAETASRILGWDESRKERISWEKTEEGELRIVLSKLGEAEGFTLPDGRTFKYCEQNGARRCDLDVLQQKYPQAYAELVTQPRHRTPRLVGKVKTVEA